MPPASFPRNTAAAPASRLRTNSTQPATVSPDARATWPASAVSAASTASMATLPHSRTTTNSSGTAQRAQRSGLPGHVGADQQQPGEAEDEREQGAGGLVDVVELAAGVVVHGGVQLADVAASKPPTRESGMASSPESWVQLVQGQQVDVPEQEQADHHARDEDQVAVVLGLLRRPAGGGVDHRREAVLRNSRLGAVLLDPLRWGFGHGTIIPLHKLVP